MNAPKPIFAHYRRQLGFSLVEVMVAIAISLILLTGVIQILASSKTSNRVLESSSRIQENGRFAIGFINDSARMAGFLGCHSTGTIEYTINDPTSYNWDYATAIQGNEGDGSSWSPALDTLVSGSVLAGTDVLVTRSVAYDGVNLVADSTSSQLVAANANNITNGDIMVVSDCSRATVFQVTNSTIAGNQVTITHGTGGSWTPGNSTADFPTNTYSASDSQVARLVTSVYYIGTGASGSPALFRQSTVAGGAMQAQELVDNVENMQVLYGEDTNSDGIANRYVNADDVGDMANVVSVRVSLLLRTDDNISSSFQTYTYDGASVTATDHRMRRVFNTTIKVRNRGIL
jgi:type IV pilus assembly protein PilW